VAGWACAARSCGGNRRRADLQWAAGGGPVDNELERGPGLVAVVADHCDGPVRRKVALDTAPPGSRDWGKEIQGDDVAHAVPRTFARAAGPQVGRLEVVHWTPLDLTGRRQPDAGTDLPGGEQALLG